MLDLTDIADSGLGHSDAMLLRFDEPSGVLPSDSCGRYQDAQPPAGLIAPTVVDETLPYVRTAKGRGRSFDGTQALYAEPKSFSDNPLQTRDDIGIAAVISWDMAAQAAYAQPGYLISTIVAPGVIGWGLRLEVIDATSRMGRMVLVWTLLGVEQVVPALEFRVPDGPFLVTASRERTAAGYVVRAAAGAANGGAYQHAGQDAAADTGFDSLVGGRLDSGGALIAAFHGVIDTLHVVSRPITWEEHELAQWALGDAVPDGRRVVTQLQPEGPSGGAGSFYPDDPNSFAQREFALEGCLLAMTRVHARRAQRYFLPDVAWGWALRYWEQVLAINLRAGDGIATRRLRATAALANVYGLSPGDLKSQLAESLNLATSSIAVTEYDDEYNDPMTPLTVDGNGLYTGGHAPAAWLRAANNRVTITEPNGVNNYLKLAKPGGSADMRYAGWEGQSTGNENNAPWYLRFCDAGGKIGRWYGKRQYAMALIDSLVTWPTSGLLAGVMMGSIIDDEWIWAGLVGNGANFDLVSLRYMGGVLDNTFTVHAATVGAVGRYIWIKHKSGNGKTHVGEYEIRHATSPGAIAAATAYTRTGGPRNPDYAGMGMVANGASTTIAGACEARFGAWWNRSPDSEAHAQLTVYRDPALAGAYDITLANVVLQRVMPAHASGSVVDRLTGFNLDNARALLDRDPLEH